MCIGVRVSRFALADRTIAAANAADFPDVIALLFLPFYWLLFVIGIFAAVGTLLGHMIVSIYIGFVVAVVLGMGLLAVVLLLGL
jgi:hypothetical protein